MKRIQRVGLYNYLNWYWNTRVDQVKRYFSMPYSLAVVSTRLAQPTPVNLQSSQNLSSANTKNTVFRLLSANLFLHGLGVKFTVLSWLRPHFPKPN